MLTGKPPKVGYSENPKENYGIRKVENNDYSKENFKKRGNEWRDLFVHDMLARNGYKVEAHKPLGEEESSNIDISFHGKQCEIKTLIATYNEHSRDPFKFVQRNVETANKHFTRDCTTEKRIVFSTYYTDFPEDMEPDILNRFSKEVKNRKFQEAIFISKDGTIKRLYKQ